MKRIIVLSDTHGFIDDSILKYLPGCDEIWHGGDWGPGVNEKLLNLGKTLRGVYGNIDGPDIRQFYPENLVFDCGGAKVLITHIAGYPGKYSARVKQLIAGNKPLIVVCGHSHILKVIYDKELNHLHINPGAAGIHGFHQVRTMVQFDIVDAKPTNMKVIELGNRF